MTLNFGLLGFVYNQQQQDQDVYSLFIFIDNTTIYNIAPEKKKGTRKKQGICWKIDVTIWFS